MRGPAKSVYADMEINVAAKIRECKTGNSTIAAQKTGKNRNIRNKGNKNKNKKRNKNKNKRNKNNNRQQAKFKYFWSIQGPNSADLSARNQPGGAH